MTLNKRRIVFLICILLFLIIAPLIILSTSGYRYDFQKNKFVKTGILVMNIDTTDVRIFVNDEERETSFKDGLHRIKNLIPDDYTIRVEKDGYTTWQKILRIESKKTTFTDTVQLFKIAEPELLFSGKVVYQDKINQKALYVQKEPNADNVILLDLKTGETQTIFPQPEQNVKIQDINIAKASWSMNQEKILIGFENNNEYAVVDLRNLFRITYVSNIYAKPLAELNWSNFGEHLLYGFHGNEFIQINLNTQKARTVTSIDFEPGDEIMKEYFVDGSNIYFFRKTNKNVQFETINFIDNPVKNKKLLILPITAQLEFVNERLALPHFIDTHEKKLYVFNQGDLSSLIEFQANTAELRNDVWLYNNDFELWVWDWIENQSKLLNRYSRQITESTWYPDGKHILFSHGDSLEIIELDTRDKVNQSAIASTNTLSNIVTNEKGTRVYYISNDGAEAGIYMVVLKEE